MVEAAPAERGVELVAVPALDLEGVCPPRSWSSHRPPHADFKDLGGDRPGFHSKGSPVWFLSLVLGFRTLAFLCCRRIFSFSSAASSNASVFSRS